MISEEILDISVLDKNHEIHNINIEKDEQWINEKFQRNCISRGIDKLSLQNNDVIKSLTTSDCPIIFFEISASSF